MFVSEKNPMFRAQWSEDTFDNKYNHERCETWERLADTLVEDVCQKWMTVEEKTELKKYISDLKFIPGGRYLYYAGRAKKFFNNCFLLKAEADTREDWSHLAWKVESCLMTGGGVGVDYSVYRDSTKSLKATGGFASGPLPAMYISNEQGRNVMQGSSRRSALYASLNWKHGDVRSFLKCKNWHDMAIPGTDISIADAKAIDFNFPAPLDMTNISVNYDTEWYLRHAQTGKLDEIFLMNCRQALSTAEPGFSFNLFDKEQETLRNAPVAGCTQILTNDGYKKVRDIVGQKVTVWTGFQWAQTKFVKTKSNVPTIKIDITGNRSIVCDPEHQFFVRQYVGLGAKRTLNITKVAAANLIVGDYLDTPYRRSELSVQCISPGLEQDVYCCDVKVEEHSFIAEGVRISNCCEISSMHDSDCCNLASLNFGRITGIAELKRICELAIKFLICGTLRADVPYEKVAKVREINRRLGLGLMGLHEWLLKRGYDYEVPYELHNWLRVYRGTSDLVADEFCDSLSISRCIAKRGIAPTGTIGILAGTTTGIEPLLSVAYKRRFLKDGTKWHHQFVIDAIAQELVEVYGLDPSNIQTALGLAHDYERRIRFQACIQEYVDQAISSTINLPAWGSDTNNPDTVELFANTLAHYAPRLRGFTCYPDGARGGQPLTPVDYNEAKRHLGREFKDNIQTNDICVLTGKGGVCGS